MAANTGASTATVQEAENQIDEESRRGRFGWCEFEKKYIPYIFRIGKQEQYTSVRIFEKELLEKLLSVLPPEVHLCSCISSSYITDAEKKLLNEINVRHTDCRFGKAEFTSKDLVVRLSDAKECYQFLDLCYRKLVLKRSNDSDRCGFFRINEESVVPYIIRANIKYMPLFYFEGETDHLKLNSAQVDGWDMAYLKFCCTVQGIRKELLAEDVWPVVALKEIRVHFPERTTFENYWPATVNIELVNHNQRTSATNWTQKPASSANNASPAQLQLFRAPGYVATAAGSAQQAAATASRLATPSAVAASRLATPSAVRQPSLQTRSFPGTVTQIKEFEIVRTGQQPYQLQKALIDQKIVPCINVKPYVFHDLMVTLPDFVRHFYPELSIEKARHMLQDILKVVIYVGNKGHREILRGMNNQFDPVPLVLVKDIMRYMPQMKYMFNNIAETAGTEKTSNKRTRVN